MTYSLILKYLRRDTNDGVSFTTCKIIDELIQGFYLVKNINPHTGEELPGYGVVSLPHLAAEGLGSAIYDTWEELMADSDDDEFDDDEEDDNDEMDEAEMAELDLSKYIN